MTKPIKKIVIVGGGTAGWISAALLKKVLGALVDIELVESEDIGRIGVGEATIPPIRHLNEVLGIDEAEFLRETKATIKLAIKFENWNQIGSGYFHTFGNQGKPMAFCHFHHFWVRAMQSGLQSSLWDYDLNYACATANKFAPIVAKDAMLDLLYAYHFDASLYANYLRKYSEKLGVTRTEGLIDQVQMHPDNGEITALVLRTGEKIEGDFFIDCSGLRGLLIQQQLDTGYEDWSHLLVNDRAIALPSAGFAQTAPYTRAIAHSIGWQWQIPLQHRNGNGLVYSSKYCSDDEAAHVLLSNIETEVLAEPNFISFKTGRRLKQWNRNVIAVGLSSGFLEPLESTSIHLIQSAIVRLLKLFPHNGCSDSLRDEYNQQSKAEFEQVRNFIILHYFTNGRDDSQYWRDQRINQTPPELLHQINLFRETGRLYRKQEDIFHDPSWVQVLIGQGIMPQDYHPLANSLSQHQLIEMLSDIKKIKQSPIAKLPTHDAFLQRVCGAAR